jgi:hypothetical protein
LVSFRSRFGPQQRETRQSSKMRAVIIDGADDVPPK